MTSPAATVVRFEPRGAGADLFRRRDPEICIAGPAGTGKSTAALFRVHLAALKNPGTRYLIARKTAASLGSTTLVTFDNQVAQHALSRGIVRWFGGSTREAAGYRYSNGARIVVGGLDNPDKIMSSEYDMILVDEATEITETDWEKLSTRLRHNALSWQQLIAACNPAGPTHWIKQRCARGAMTMLVSRHRDNPAYYNADGTPTAVGTEYMARLDALTGVRRLRLLDGIWAAAEGVIYDQWDEAVHLVDPFTPPDDWTRYWSIDFGFVNPFVCGFWAVDHDGGAWLYREIYRTQRLVEDHAADILRTVSLRGRWAEPTPRAIICDHDAEDRATLERHLGLPTKAARKSVSDGIQAVQARLRPAGNGRPRLHIVRTALLERDNALVQAGLPTCTADEIPGYVWEPAPDGKPLKDRPLKANDHGCDMTRYLCAELDLVDKVRSTRVRDRRLAAR